MPTINYVLKDETIKQVDSQNGTSIMEAAILNNVDGIEAECGGSCSCATCHVYVSEAFMGLLPPPDAMEDELLDGTAAERRPNSRLSCQLSMSDALDGIVVQIPETQI
ncbi:MAG TPA: 2Fe-2S iron-sulfur cluster-binding protein [Castellaniella sp.]|nr:2Fe-2S iron-sulfur cluster-binding protein [Castellaniella sp.]